MKNGQDYIMALTSNRNDACKPIFAKANWISLHDNTAPISRPQKKKSPKKSPKNPLLSSQAQNSEQVMEMNTIKF